MMQDTKVSSAADGPRSEISPRPTSFWALTLGSIGVVYGDIGTSPLYALRESVLAAVGSLPLHTLLAVVTWSAGSAPDPF